MTTHTELLNYLAAKHNLKSYLEIGVQNPANNFNRINCEYKKGVDPEKMSNPRVVQDTSDDFFKYNKSEWDLIFIDGLHHADQVKRDFENALRCLNDGGYIVIHDTLPEKEETTFVPRGTQIVWHGDVYKFAMELSNYNGVNFKTVDFDNGCTVVWKDINCNSMPIVHKSDWYNFIMYKGYLLDVIKPSEIETSI